MFTGLFSKPNVDIVIDDNGKRKRYKVKDVNGNGIINDKEKVNTNDKDNGDKTFRLPTFSNKDPVTGKIVIDLNSIKSFDHKGIKIELIGLIESASSSSLLTSANDSFSFITLTTELEPPGLLGTTITTFPFKFSEVELKYDTYKGALRNVKYIIRLIIEVKLKSLVYEKEFAVMNYDPQSIIDSHGPFNLEIGVEDWLLLYFHINKMGFALKDSIMGTVLFKNIGIKLKTMELHVIKREMLLGDTNANINSSVTNLNENSTSVNNKTIGKYQIMDGGPSKNETIVIRFPLKTFLLTPSYQNIANRLSVQYFMNIVLYDIEDRKYSKQHEMFMYRVNNSNNINNNKKELDLA